MIEYAIAPLFVPGDKPDILPKAARSNADAIIFDLEDAVAPDQKNAARSALSGPLACDVSVRLNGIQTQWFDDDVAAIVGTQITSVILPKVETSEEITELTARLPHRLPIIALIESATGIENIVPIAKAADRLAFGSLDFAADLGCAHEATSLLYFRSRIVLASRLAGLPPPLDGVTADFSDSIACAADTEHAKKLGFSGKLCIHPNQIEIVLNGFSPTDAEIAWARTAVAAGPGVNNVNGVMVDGPVRLRAQRVLDLVSKQKTITQA